VTPGTAILNAPRHRTTLSRGLLKNDWLELGFLPKFGCHWTRLRLSVKGEWVDFLKPVVDGDALLDRPTGHGSYILAPWSNRIPGGKFQFENRHHRIRTNHPDDTAIHGDVRMRPWNVADSTSTFFEATLDTRDVDDFNYPFALHFRHRLELLDDRLVVSMTVENVDPMRAPVGLGYCPCFLRRPTWRDDDEDVIVQVPAERVYPSDDSHPCTPTGPAGPVDGITDLRGLRPLGPRNLDHCFTSLERNHFRIIYPGSRVEVRFEFDENFTHAVVHAPTRKDGSAGSFVAVEPVTHATNAINLHTAGQPDTGLKILDPGETWQTSWSLSAGDL